jgi:hypothetical protein
MSSTAVVTSLSEYEVKRAQIVERNNAKLRELGLISAKEEHESNAIAWKHSRAQDSKSQNDDDEQEGRKRKAVKDPVSPSRKSQRLQGVAVDGRNVLDIEAERTQRVLECREARQRAAIAYAETGKKGNPTATYEHCLIRVQTMTAKGLANRVKAIERAAGKHCVVKMAIFKSCLQDQELWDLAELASEALERLKAMQPLPEK